MKTTFSAVAVGLACLALTACTVHQTEAPPVSGPSDLALSLRVDASPDTVSLDGGSTSTITVSAFGPDGRPLPSSNYATKSVLLRFDTVVGGQVQDIGQLTARSVTTDGNGVARVTFTAPSLPPNADAGTCRGLPGTCVTILVTPQTSASFGTAQTSSVEIRMVPVGVILPPATTPTPCITVSPSGPSANTPARFIAGTTVGTTCSTSVASDIVSFDWNFGDGSTGSGREITHTYAVTGSYVVTLTETNNRGIAASATLTVSVAGGAPPSASFTTSPADVTPGQTVFFNASSSKAGTGHTLTSFSWNFGDGKADGSGMTTSHVYDAIGQYTVTLTVTDEAGQSSTTSQKVPVVAPGAGGGGGGSGGPSAAFSFQAGSAATHTVSFDAGASTGTAPLTYTWLFGEGSSAGNGVQTSHSYLAAGTFSVTLTVKDSSGATATKTQIVTAP